jgi:hypothetical protein
MRPCCVAKRDISDTPMPPCPSDANKGVSAAPTPPPSAHYVRTQSRRRPPALYRLCQADELQRYRLRHEWEVARGGWGERGER